MTTLTVDFAQGAVLGFSIAAPVEPIGLLCIRRTLEHGAAAGVMGGLGTAAADAVYAALAAFGLTAASTMLTAIALPLQVAGILMLVWLGVRTMIQAPAATVATPRATHAGLFALTFFLTLTNPATVLSFTAIFAGIGLVTNADPLRASVLVGGTFFGSLAWWIILSCFVSALRTGLRPEHLMWINRAAGGALIVFAAVFATNAARLAL